MPRSSVAVFLVLATAACGGVATPPDDPDADPAQPDATPGLPDAGGNGAPSVVSVTPADGAIGVAADAVITIAFSEPMDPASVEAAWTSTDLPAADVAFAWNAGGDTLTVTPNALLTLATGTGLDPSLFAAQHYTIGVAATATDGSGVALAAPVSSQFSTTKRMSVDLAKLSSLSLTMRDDGVTLAEGAVNREIGDTLGNLQYKTFASFAVPEFPAGAAIESARLVARQVGPSGTPYGLGTLNVRHVNTATLDAAAFTAPGFAILGTFSNDTAIEDKDLDVTVGFADDLENHTARGDRTQYRLEFATATDNDGVADYASFNRDSFVLTVTYLAD
jgi:hypothetical protein